MCVIVTLTLIIKHPCLLHTGFTYERFRCYCTLQPMRSPSGHNKLGEYYLLKKVGSARLRERDITPYHIFVTHVTVSIPTLVI